MYIVLTKIFGNLIKIYHHEKQNYTLVSTNFFVMTPNIAFFCSSCDDGY